MIDPFVEIASCLIIFMSNVENDLEVELFTTWYARMTNHCLRLHEK